MLTTLVLVTFKNNVIKIIVLNYKTADNRYDTKKCCLLLLT